jgi:hypothetical protein
MRRSLLGFIGSWMGAQIALLSFKRQRAFDKQLDWYERAAGAIHSMRDKIQIAYTFEKEKTEPDTLKGLWQSVQGAHVDLDRLALESALYADDKTITLMTAIAEKVQQVANKTEAFDPPRIKSDKNKLLEEIFNLSTYLQDESKPLLQQGRIHLEIDRQPFWHRLVGARSAGAMSARTSAPTTNH